MSSTVKKLVLSITALALVSGLGLSAMADVTGRPHDLSLDNPQGHCLNCHDLHQTGLGSGFAHNLKRANEILICYQCHAGALNDYTSIDPSFPNWTVLMSSYDIRAEFEGAHMHYPNPPNMDGEMNKCSDCHNPHGVFDSTSTTRLPKLLSAGPDAVTDTDEFCFVCHNNDPSPPHLPFSNISVGSQYRFSRNTYMQMTHSTFYRATTITEPVPDTARTYDDNPYGKDKDISCLTCHLPHGSDYQHMLRRQDDQDFCLECHNGSKAATLGMFTTSGHGKAGVDRICQECHFPHGTGQENAVKTAITDPGTGASNAANVNGLGMNEACFACHNGSTFNDETGSAVYTSAFGSSISGWTQASLTNTWDASYGHAAPGSLKQVSTGTGDRYSKLTYYVVQPSTQYTYSAWMYLPSAVSGSGAFLRVIERTSADAVVADKSASGTTSTGGTWIFKRYDFTTAGTTGRVELRLNMSSVGTVYWDELMLTKTVNTEGYYSGKTAYNASAHKQSPNALNPGNEPGEDSPGDCGNCHNVHGTAANYGKMLLDTNDETLCYVCHNASTPNTASGEDVQAAFSMASHHDLGNVRCVSCHNVHKATAAAVMMDPLVPGTVMTDKEAFCLKCHSGSAPSGVTAAPNINSEWSGGGHDTVLLACPDCHLSHGSVNPNALLNYEALVYNGYTAAFTAAIAFGDNALCELCHNRTGAGYKNARQIPTGAGYVSQHNEGSGATCTDCHAKKHDPTLANYTGSASFYTDACLDCHTAGAGNPFPDPDADFNTPANGADLDVYTSIHNITYAPGSAVDCEKCHGAAHETDHSDSQRIINPDAGTPLSSPTNAFCIACHDATPITMAGVTPPDIDASWTTGGHNDGQLLCTDCHEYHASANRFLLNTQPVVSGGDTASFFAGLNPDSREYCELCHNRTAPGFKGADVIPVGAQYVAQHGLADSTPCSDCHMNKHNPTLGSEYYTNACLGCHTAGAGNPFPDPNAQFNTPTSISDANTRRSIHDITYDPAGGTVDCEKCHGETHETDHDDAHRIVNPDTGDLPVNSITTSNEFCYKCHDSSPITMAGITPRDIMSTFTSAGHGSAAAGNQLCYECHEYHGSYSEMLLKQTVNGQPVMSSYSGNNVTFCIACHRGMDQTTPLWSGYTVYSGSIHAYGNESTGNYTQDGRHGPGVCTNCHDPHGVMIDGVVTDNLMVKEGEDLCFTCHASGYDNFSTSGDYNNNWTRLTLKPYPLDIEKAGGALHFGRTVVGAGEEMYDILESSVAFPDKDCTVSVELKVPEFTRSDGYESVGMDIVDTKNSGNYARLFYRAHSDPHAWVNRYTSDPSVATIPLFGDEATAYHTLKLVRNEGAGTFDAYVDDTLVRSGSFDTSGYFKVRIYCSITQTSDGTPETVEAYFDDFKVVYTGYVSVHNTASGANVQAAFLETKSHHNISDEDQIGPDGIPGTDDDSKIECDDCHDPHTITKEKMAYTVITTTGELVAVTADQSFCIKCHSDNPPDGVLYPVHGVWDKRDYLNSAHGNDLMRSKTFGNYSNGESYACKVCHHPHGSNQNAQQRESFDINMDGIPDDIDGDGVLDSPDLVGYMGYSGCSGPPMFVVYTTGRPDSSCFARISSTVPYQANGKIDVEMCLNCHDGSPAPDVETDFLKHSHHDVFYADQVASGGSYIECYHCHDQHTAQFPYTSINMFATTDPYPPRNPMPSDAPFCLRCHDLTLPAGLSFGNQDFKNIKLSYNPSGKVDAKGYDVLNNFTGHYRLSDGAPLMCKVCHNQHGSDYEFHIRDNTEAAKPGHDPDQPIQEIQALELREEDQFGGGDLLPLSSTAERCLACHSGKTTYEGGLIPLPPPPDDRGFALPPVGKHPDLKPEITVANGNETGGHIYSNTFAVITAPGSVKQTCVFCHDSHNPNIMTVNNELMACYQCHNANTSLPDTQTEFNDNQTDPAHSASIHPITYNPAGTTPAFVECLKCHDQSKHMQGVVRLRKDPSSFDNFTSDAEVWVVTQADKSAMNAFCLECHDPDTTVESGFNRGGAHVAPKLPPGYASGAHFADGSLLCTDCHEYHASTKVSLLKKTIDPATTALEETFCYSCHDDPANSMSGIDVQAEFTATASHHQVGAAEQAASGSKVECSGCHNVHTATRAKPVVHADDPATAVSVDDSFCIGCHDSDGSAGVMFPGFANGTSGPEWNPSTGAWNRWNKAAFAGSSHDGQGIGCIDCHTAHGSANYSLLLSNISSTTGITVSYGTHSTPRGDRVEEVGVNDVCYACHEGAMGIYGGETDFKAQTFGTATVDKNCSYCHNPHGSSLAKMIRSDKPLMMNMTSASYGSVYNFQGFGNPDTGKPYYTFCSSRGCHASTAEGSTFDVFVMDNGGANGLLVDNFSGDGGAPSHHPVKDGTIGCLDCHKEHGSADSNAQPSLRARYYRQSHWPNTRHAGSGMYSGPPTRSLTYRPHGYTASYKYNYDPSTFDGRNYYEYPNGHWPQIINPATPSYANDLCFSCHNKDDIIGTASGGMTGANTNFIGHEAVVGGAVISQDISYKGSGVGSDYHKFSCSMCHYSHSSRKGKLLRRSCFSQNDGDTIYDNYYSQQYSDATMFKCHPYRSWGSGDWNTRGWRVQTKSPAKTDYARPANPVDNLTFTVNANLDIRLDWTSVEDQPGAGAHHYDVYVHTSEITQTTKPQATKVAAGLVGGAPASPMTWTDYTGQPNTTYYYIVIACDAENNESFISNCVEVALGPDTVKPASISAQTISQPDGTLDAVLTWSDPGDNVNVTEYRVYRKDGAAPLTDGDLVELNRIATVPDTSLSATGSADAVAYSYTDSTPALGQCYGYAVVAVDAAGNLSPAPVAGTRTHCVVDPKPAAVTTLVVNPVTKALQASLSWSAPANVGALSGYNVYRRESLPITQTEIDLGATYRVASLVQTTGWTDTAVPLPAKDYYYTVTAVDVSSGQESVLGNNDLVIIPTTPVFVSAARVTDSDVLLSWNEPSDTLGMNYYRLYMQKDGAGWAQIATPTEASYTKDLTGQEPGTYEFYVCAYYGSYGGTTPYETMDSNVVSTEVTDTTAPGAISASCLLTPASNYKRAQVSWTAPSDNNYAGYTPAGVDHYKVEKSYNDGAWTTVTNTRLANPGFEAFTGTIDDGAVDTFTGWTISNTYAYAVSRAMCDASAIKIVFDGDGDKYIHSAEPDTGASVAGKTYSVSFWARANKPVTFQFFLQENGGSGEWQGTKTLAIGTEWTRFSTSGTFTAFATATSARIVIRPSNDTTAEISLDGVRLMQGSGALQPDDGSFYQPAGYDVPSTPLTFTDIADLPDGGNSARYRVRAVDGQYNSTAAATTNYVYSKPTAVDDLFVFSSSDESANVLVFGPSSTLVGLSHYNIYAKKQGTPLIAADLVPANLAGTHAPSAGANIALSATASASHEYSASYAAYKANDGSTSTRWDGLQSVGPNWLKLDFGTEVPLASVSFNMYNSYSYRPQDYLIQTWNGTGWVTQKTVVGNASNTPAYSIDPPVMTSQVRIYITKTSNTTMSYRPIIYEFYAYAAETYIHDMFNTSVQAEPGCAFAYAVVPEDNNGMAADISSGSSTVNTVPDYEPPARITDLTLTSPVGSDQVVLKWNRPEDNDGIGCTQTVQFEIYQMPVSLLDTPEPVTDANLGSALLVHSGAYTFGNYTNTYTATWYDHEDVYYGIRSADDSGFWSQISNSPALTVGVDKQAPSPPTITSCVPGPSPEVDIYWTPAIDNVGINGYKLYRANADVEPFATDGCITENNLQFADVAIGLIAYDATAATDAGGTPGNRYYYALKAWDHEDNMSNISNCGEATVRTVATDTTPPTWPGPSPLAAIQQPYPDIDLTWSAATDLDNLGGAGAIDRYKIYRSESSFAAVTDPGVSLIATVSGIRNSYIDDTGVPETTYYYALVAVDASAGANASSMSNVASAAVLPAPSPDNSPPSVPGSLQAGTGVYPYINLSWTASTDEDDAANPQNLYYYKLYRSEPPVDITDANKGSVVSYVVPHDYVSYTVTGTGSGTLYNFRIEAVDLAGNVSGLSNQVSASLATAPCVDTTPPYAPSNLGAFIGPSPDIDLSWTASTDNGGGCASVVDHYNLYRTPYSSPITPSTDLSSIIPRRVPGNSTIFTDSTGQPNTAYWYVLTAVDSAGNESGMSNIITKMTAADLMAPAAITDLKAEGLAGPKTHLSWCRPSDNVGVDHYEIYRKQQNYILSDSDIIPANRIEAAFTNAGACLSYDDTDVTSGVTYSYAVISVDAAGNRSTISSGHIAGDTIAAVP